MIEQATMTKQETKKNEATRQMQQLLVRAMKDEAWRQELLTNPKMLIEHELGVTLPQGVTIQVHEDTPTTVHLVLPTKAPSSELEEWNGRPELRILAELETPISQGQDPSCPTYINSCAACPTGIWSCGRRPE